MVKISGLILKNIVDDIQFETLSPDWTYFNYHTFSSDKNLFDYQKTAIKNSLKALNLYFDQEILNQSDRKDALFSLYSENGLDEDQSIKLSNLDGRGKSLLQDFYPTDNDNITYKHFINRMSFWMATGSGKTLVLIKLIEILKLLMDRKKIPERNLLFLTYRDDLIGQFTELVDEYNDFNNSIKIRLHNLKKYPEYQNQQHFEKENEVRVFYYRSDNISDIQKDKIIDFKNYYNHGKWYVFLDEAHKGDKEESIRQHIYSLFSRQGFLFNFSATFTDLRDLYTCVFEYSLPTFIESGYGKRITLLHEEIREFNKKEDYSDTEKQKIVLKSIILYCYIKKNYRQIRELNSITYHDPLMLTLVNTVNTKDADLKLFFRVLVDIANRKVKENIVEEVKNELKKTYNNRFYFLFDNKNYVTLDDAYFQKIDYTQILKDFFNSESSGNIEVIRNSSNTKEIAFKLKTSSIPFALIKIGDVGSWIKQELKGYEIQEKFEADESFFADLNNETSYINLLMGSMSFYEGWDSNRPNIINYINIGKGESAKKFILQSIGRGVRIEPLIGERKRLISLYNMGIIPNDDIEEKAYQQLKKYIPSLETLFIMATNRKAIRTILKQISEIKQKQNKSKLDSIVLSDGINKDNLYIPTYSAIDDFKLKEKYSIKFNISKSDYDLLNRYFNYISDDRTFLIKYNADPLIISKAREYIQEKPRFRFIDRDLGNLDVLIQKYFDFYNSKVYEFGDFKKLNKEIIHFKNILIDADYLKDVNHAIENVADYPEKIRDKKSLYQELPYEKFIKEMAKIKKEIKLDLDNNPINIRYLSHHFYNPVIISKKGKNEAINHIINIESEKGFLDALEEYLDSEGNKFEHFDWWVFSKIDENIDQIFIPYFDTFQNKTRRFYPDFIFWLKKDEDYYIFFVDPKGTEHISWVDKINGYKQIFEKNGKPKTINFSASNVKVLLYLWTDDLSKITHRLPKLSRYWVEDINSLLKIVT